MARNIPTELVLLQIAEGLQTLAKNPDLSKIIKQAYALSEVEQKKADEAMEVMASADAFLAEIKKKQDALAVIDERIKDAEKLKSLNADTLVEIKRQQAAVDSQASINKADANANKKELLRLNNINSALDARAEALAKGEKEIASAKADLKKRADAMKELVA